jgi:hypothetical protein
MDATWFGHQMGLGLRHLKRKGHLEGDWDNPGQEQNFAMKSEFGQ